MIKNGVNSNETLTTKNLYLCYDKDDNNQRFSECKVEREKMLKNLPKIENEQVFKIIKYPSKINLSRLRSQKLENNNRYGCKENELHSFSVNKKLWFSNDKNNNYI